MSEKKITVGPGKGDVKGNDNSAIQQAVDMLDKGGVVELLEGEYECVDGIYMRSGVRLIGQGEKTVLVKSPGFRSPLKIDADYGQLKITPEDASGFKQGMGISVKDNGTGGWTSSTAQITDIKEGTLFVDTHLKMDYSVPREGFVSNAHALIKGYRVKDAAVENICIQGGKETNFKMDGCRGGAVYWYKSENCTMTGIEVRDFNGDGISFQITRDMKVEDCTVSGATNIGLHPGTGSERVNVKNCTLTENGSGGFFLCWRVQESLFEDIICNHNRDFGISIGHKDTDNIFRQCIMKENGNVGLRFRQEDEYNGAHRNTWEQCVCEDNKNTGIEINGVTYNNLFSNCLIQGTNDDLQKTAVVFEKETGGVEFNDCVIQGEVKDNREK